MSYLKGKDIKQKGDCLTYCFIKKIEITGNLGHLYQTQIPEGFEKW